MGASSGIGGEPGLGGAAVTPSDSTALDFRFLYVGTGGGGTVVVVDRVGNTVTFSNVQDGAYIWIAGTRVKAATTCSNIVALN